MKNSFDVRVLYADTDAYNVVWHGAYIKWLERGRTEFCDELLDIRKTEESGTIFPVIEMNLQYKVSAKLFDKLKIETELIELKKTSFTFEQRVVRDDGTVCLIGTVKLVSTTTEGKLNRKIPQEIYEKLNNA